MYKKKSGQPYYTNRHSCFLLQYHMVLVTKYRKPVLDASNDTEATTEAEDADADADAESLGDVSIADEDAENVDVDVAADAE